MVAFSKLPQPCHAKTGKAGVKQAKAKATRKTHNKESKPVNNTQTAVHELSGEDSEDDGDQVTKGKIVYGPGGSTACGRYHHILYKRQSAIYGSSVVILGTIEHWPEECQPEQSWE